VSLARDQVGHDAGWHLRFFTEPVRARENVALSIGSGDYHAEISATLPGTLDGGTYAFAIEGITNAHYKALHEIWSARPRRPLHVDLYLYWRDTTGPFGYLASIAGLTDARDRLSGVPPADRRVARLTVTRLSRRTGSRRYEAVIEARERVFESLGRRLSAPPRPAATALDAAAQVADALEVAFEKHPVPRPPAAGPAPRFEIAAGKKGTAVFSELEQPIGAEAQRSGLAVYVIRDGVVHIGAGRTVPLAGEVKALDAAGGLVHVETTERSAADPAEEADAAASPPPSHVHYALTLKGRPDVRPGDLVSFADPFTDDQGNLFDPASALNATTSPSSLGDALQGLGASLLGGGGALVGGPVTMYVTGVCHRLSRTEGFVTTAAGMSVQRGREWDEVRPERNASGRPSSPPAATPHEELAGAIQDLVAGMTPEAIAVGEVRAATPSGDGEPPGQTVDVWLGLAGDDGMPHRARRLEIDRARKSRQSGVPYATPFAWGRCGLVLPRYPGTRVLLAHAGGSSDDAVDIGALWPSGHGPDARAGDWWLILPAAVEPSARQSAADEVAPAEPTGAATNDLIDADGERTIEVGRLTIRVKPGNLRPPGERPAPPSDQAEQVTIEHESGSRIVIKDDGDIVIESAKDLTLSTRTRMTLEADDVVVKVRNSMDVGDR
jgi:hypothetical protein